MKMLRKLIEQVALNNFYCSQRTDDGKFLVISYDLEIISLLSSVPLNISSVLFILNFSFIMYNPFKMTKSTGQLELITSYGLNPHYSFHIGIEQKFYVENGFLIMEKAL